MRRGLMGLLCMVVLFATLLPASAHFSFLTSLTEVKATSSITHFSFPADTVSRIMAQPVLHVEDEEEIPDSLLHPRWKIQKTAPIEVADLDTSAVDLHLPENIRQQVEYNDSTGMYVIGSKIGDSYLNAPLLMTPEEYHEWSEKRELRNFFRKKDAENVANKGKEKFSFADMHFDLGPAEKIFGPGGVRIKTQGTAELKLGGTFKNIDNPSLPEANRRTKAIDLLTSTRKSI